MAGWIKIHREIDNHWIAKDLTKLGWWVYLLYKASHEDNKVLIGNRLIEVKRGQLIISLSALEERWNTSRPTVLNFIKLLEKEQMVYRSVYQKVTILTICNYDDYQGVREQQVTDSFTDSLPIPLPIRYPTKEDKEEKNINNNISNAPVRVREESVEDSYARRYREEGMWMEASMTSHMKIPEVQQIFEEFLVEQSHNSTTHIDYSDFKRHFLNYLRVRAEVIRKQKKQDNGNNSRNSQRRGVQVVANQVDDYEGAF